MKFNNILTYITPLINYNTGELQLNVLLSDNTKPKSKPEILTIPFFVELAAFNAEFYNKLNIYAELTLKEAVNILNKYIEELSYRDPLIVHCPMCRIQLFKQGSSLFCTTAECITNEFNSSFWYKLSIIYKDNIDTLVTHTKLEDILHHLALSDSLINSELGIMKLNEIIFQINQFISQSPDQQLKDLILQYKNMSLSSFVKLCKCPSNYAENLIYLEDIKLINCLDFYNKIEINNLMQLDSELISYIKYISNMNNRFLTNFKKLYGMLS